MDIPVCSKYGAIKSITSSRSDVMVNEATTMSSSCNDATRRVEKPITRVTTYAFHQSTD